MALLRGGIHVTVGDTEEEVASFLTLVGAGDATLGETGGKVDVLAHLEEVPETLLAIMKTEATLLPADVDAGAIDEEVSAEELESTTILSNPVRINFVDGA